MDLTLENSLLSYLEQTEMSFFFSFSFSKLENKRAKQVLSGGLVPVGREVWKGCRRVDIVQILCTHVCKWKNDSC
jgi:hypothetical protein